MSHVKHQKVENTVKVETPVSENKNEVVKPEVPVEVKPAAEPTVRVKPDTIPTQVTVPQEKVELREEPVKEVKEPVVTPPVVETVAKPVQPVVAPKPEPVAQVKPDNKVDTKKRPVILADTGKKVTIRDGNVVTLGNHTITNYDRAMNFIVHAVRPDRVVIATRDLKIKYGMKFEDVFVDM